MVKTDSMTRYAIKRALGVWHEEGVASLSRKVLGFIDYHWRKTVVIAKINAIKRMRSIDEIIDSAMQLDLVYMMQKRYEIKSFLQMLLQNRPKYILEIGTAGGGSLLLMSRVARENAVIISIDLPEGQFGGGYPKYRESLYRSFASPKQKMYLLRASSHEQSSLRAVLDILDGNLLDLLFIDGDHSYEGVKIDFDMYKGIVSKGGVIAFHDIVAGDISNAGEVSRFWSETKNAYSSNEIVESWDQGGMGIGWIENT